MHKHGGSRREIPFFTPADLVRAASTRPIVLFGSGIISEKTLRIVNRDRVECIVDNASNLWSESQDGIPILSPTERFEESPRPFFVICTTSFEEVASQLEASGFIGGQEYCVSPVLNDLRIIDELEDINARLLVTSGSPERDSPLYGGGIYELTIEGDHWEHRKVRSGNCYGLIPFEDGFISVDTEIGIFELDRQYNIVRRKQLPTGMRAHGVAFSEEHRKFVVVGSYLDGFLVLDEDFRVERTVHISNKKERSGKPAHHCNDCCIVGDSIYVSMFSATGNWKRDVYDGCVMEFDLLEDVRQGLVFDDLWMPHNISMLDGSLHVLDSLPGHLRSNNGQVVGTFPAFTRGLAFDGVFYYIGQSRNRNFSRSLGTTNNISIDAGVIVFDPATKVSRFCQLPPKLSEVHALVLLDPS